MYNTLYHANLKRKTLIVQGEKRKASPERKKKPAKQTKGLDLINQLKITAKQMFFYVYYRS